MASRLVLAIGAIALAAAAQPAAAQPAKLRLGLYAPTVEFGTAQARLAYAQSLARTIEQATGIKTEAQAYASIAALNKDAVDFAIVDGPCVSSHPSWRLLATATVGASTPTRPWALYASTGDSMQALRGKKLAFIAIGCNDTGFVDHAMLESEVAPSFFGARVAEKDLSGALASVTSYKTAHAVFAPVGSAKGLSKVFDAGVVPNPGFVQLAPSLPATVTDKVTAAVTAFGGSGAITGWSKPSREPYLVFAARMSPSKKAGVFATPEPVRLDGTSVLARPPTLDDTALVPVRHHFVRRPGARME